MSIDKIINTKKSHLILPIGVEVSLTIEKEKDKKCNWYIKYDNISSVVQLPETTNSLIVPIFYKEKSFQYICEAYNGEKEEKYIIDIDIVKLFSEKMSSKQEYILGEKVFLQLDINKNIAEDICICWQRYNNETGKWEDVSDEKILEIIPKEIVYENKSYRAVVKYDEFEIASKTYDIFWNKVIKEQPVAKGVLFNDDKLKLQVKVVDSLRDKIKYHWQYKEGEADWQYIDYAEKGSYTVRSSVLEHVITDIRCELRLEEECIYTEPSEIICLKRGKHFFVIEPIQNTVFAKVGEKTSLEVIVKSEFPVKYRWEKLVDKHYVGLDSKYNTPILSFEKVKRLDSGIYRCIAFNDDEELISEDIELNVASDYKSIDAKALIVVNRKDNKLIQGKEIYHKSLFKGLIHFDNFREAINNLEAIINIPKKVENFSENVVNNSNFQENSKVSIEDIVYLDIFLHKNDAIKLIDELFDDENREEKLVELYGKHKYMTNVSLLSFANIVNEFVQIPKIYEILMRECYCVTFDGEYEIYNKNLYNFELNKSDLKMFFRTFRCQKEIISWAICELSSGAEYIVIIVDDNEDKCFDETMKLIEYVLN